MLLLKNNAFESISRSFFCNFHCIPTLRIRARVPVCAFVERAHGFACADARWIVSGGLRTLLSSASLAHHAYTHTMFGFVRKTRGSRGERGLHVPRTDVHVFAFSSAHCSRPWYTYSIHTHATRCADAGVHYTIWMGVRFIISSYTLGGAGCACVCVRVCCSHTLCGGFFVSTRRTRAFHAQCVMHIRDIKMRSTHIFTGCYVYIDSNMRAGNRQGKPWFMWKVLVRCWQWLAFWHWLKRKNMHVQRRAWHKVGVEVIHDNYSVYVRVFL